MNILLIGVLAALRVPEMGVAPHQVAHMRYSLHGDRIVYTAEPGYYFWDNTKVATQSLDSARSPKIAAPERPSIYPVTARLHYPLNGTVDLIYRTSCIRGAVADGTNVTLIVTANDRSSGRIYTAERSCLKIGRCGDAAPDDVLALTSGWYHLVWDMKAQGLDFASDNVVFTVSAGPLASCTSDSVRLDLRHP